MTDGTFPDRVVQLRSRWEADPTSRVFLQLAEEYRHLGRVKEALEVLEKGLKEHPGYLSALVAKGRCYLELGEPQLARGVLERVVKQDATQMVANKMLVRAYLETGEPGQARERLDLYSLLNDSDPEIEDLRRRIKAAERPAPPPPPLEDVEAEPEPDEPFAFMDAAAPAPKPSPVAVPAAPAPAPPPMEDDVFDLGLAPAAPARAAAMDVFELDVPAPASPSAEPGLLPLAVVPTAPDPFTAAEEVAVIQSPVEVDATDDVFGFAGVTSRGGQQQRYLAGLAAEGIFDFEPQQVAAPATAAPPTPAPVPVREPEPVFGLPPVTPEAAAPPSIAASGSGPAEMPAAEPPRFMTWADPAPFAELAEPAMPLPETELTMPEPEPVAPEPEPFALEPFPAAEPAPPVFPEAAPFDMETPEAPAWEPEPVPAPALFEPEPVPVEDLEPPVYAAPEPGYAEPAATMTLGELYLRQGHLQEARRIFGEILEREPDHAAAHDGLERVGQALTARERRPVEASELLAGFDPDAAESGANARKVFLLNSYLARVRRGRQRDVS